MPRIKNIYPYYLNFLEENPNLDRLQQITANERSFQVFRDEKWLLSKHGKDFLQRIGFALDDLRCYLTFEPFFLLSEIEKQA